MARALAIAMTITWALVFAAVARAAEDTEGAAFFERRIRPLLIEHCYACHSEEAEVREGDLLLDRRSGWLKGGGRGAAVVLGEPGASLLINAVCYEDESLQMPPDYALDADDVRLLEQWVRRGAPGPAKDPGETDFSHLGDQEYLFSKAKDHWAFKAVASVEPHQASDPEWNGSAVDQFVLAGLLSHDLTPSDVVDSRTLIRRLTYDLTGLPPPLEEVERFCAAADVDRRAAIEGAVDRLLDSPAFGEHFGRMWLDVARYADTDSFYRPDTRTPHYFPFAFTYRDYVIDAFNADKPYDRFVREQLAADLLGLDADARELAALGFLAVGPHANRNQPEALDDWIDVTTRGLMGITAACARCHDHKYEPVPTADYYSLHGIFASIVRPNPLDEKRLPVLAGYSADERDRADYQRERAVIDHKLDKAVEDAKGASARATSQKIRETDLAELLLFHPGAPAHMMVVTERGKPTNPFVFVRGDPSNRGESVPRRFLRILDPVQQPFPDGISGRLQLADKIVARDNPLTARVFVNRVFGIVMGAYLVDTPSDFGMQGSRPTHPELLDWLAAHFMSHEWSVKWLVRTLALSRTYQQSSDYRADMVAIDPQNRQLWRANRRHLSIEAIHDSLLAVAGRLDRSMHGHAAPLWGDNYTHRRAIYGYINRFNLDPTLRVFDFPTPMQSQPARGESIVASQALFAMNSPFVIDQALAIAESDVFLSCANDERRITALFEAIFQRQPDAAEVSRVRQFIEQQRLYHDVSMIRNPWPLVAQALLMSNEFQYVD